MCIFLSSITLYEHSKLNQKTDKKCYIVKFYILPFHSEITE